MESISPKFCFHFPSPHLRIRITTLVERGRKFKINSFVEREISVCFENRFELGIIDTPEQNLTAFDEPRCGTPEGRPTDFPPFFQRISENSARLRALFCFGGGGAKSEAILTVKILKRIFDIF